VVRVIKFSGCWTVVSHDTCPSSADGSVDQKSVQPDTTTAGFKLFFEMTSSMLTHRGLAIPLGLGSGVVEVS
jgi:hypothetical protein